ncbi:uncharacterized protein [Euphorbia lathyris]|uniref:uncharacterized protein isoform X2 n=1 Tax=Euphorbia lathyris TaxID=212925 RepID=UPI0033141627
MALEAIVELITDPIKQYIVTPITRRIGYALNCNSKVPTLQDEVQKLKYEKESLQHAVDEATRNGEEIFEDVTKWLINAEKAIEDAEELVEGKEEATKRCLVGLCPNLKTRYQLSKKAHKKALAIDMLLRSAQGFDSISFMPHVQQIVEPSVYSREALPSRVSMLNQIMDALRDPTLNMLGVYGMGGIGKTTLAKEVQGEAVAEKLFETVVMVVVSQTPEMGRIQTEIADFLGLKFDAEELPVRASLLHKRLENSKALIILDDLWHKLDLNAIGIPYGDASKGCKIMLTSRSRDLLFSEMRAQKLFSLEALNDEETLKLFEMSVAKAKDPKFHAIASEIAKKCAGLPLLIQIVANDLRNKESSVWNDMLNQLSSFGNKEIEQRVYNVIESSYEKLPGKEVKSFFLLCALFGQSNIRIQYLLTHSMGLSLFKGIRNIEGAREKVLTLIRELQANSLLLDGDMIGFVKMHNVVRDVALLLASREQHAFIGTSEVTLRDWPSKDCTRISLPYCDVDELPVALECPEAELFLLFTEDLCLQIPDSFFKGIGRLKVVDFTGMRLVSLPTSITLLTKLQTLCLHRCRLDKVAIIGELKQLELLSFADSKIIELPTEIAQLSYLKLLDLRNCSSLQVIPENVLSKLCSLEELYVLNSFVRWNAKGNASLVELESLPSLSTLEIQIVNSKSIPQGCRFVHRLRSYKISIGDGWGNWKGNDERSRTLKLKLDAGVYLEDGIEVLLRGTEDLYLSEAKGNASVLYDLDRQGFPQLKHLHIQNDYSIQHLIKSTIRSSCRAFPILESLYLNNLMSLEKICYGQLEMGSFGELRTLKISGCDKLNCLFSFSSAKCLRQLQELEVESCENMEAIVGEGSEDEYCNNEVIEFIRLSSLKLKYLPNFTGFCKTNEGTALRELLSNVSFPNLLSLEVYKCDSLKYVFTMSMVKFLAQLKRLDIRDCKLVEEIVQTMKHEEIEEEGIVFPKLDSLQLDELPNVERFGCGYSIEFALLRELNMIRCNAMKNFVSKFSSNKSDEECLFNEMVSFSNLETLEVKHMNFKYLWDEQFKADNSFTKLKSLSIQYCSKLSTVFPSIGAYQRFQRLKSLYVSNCDGVEEIYQYRGINFKEINNVEAFSLRDLQIMRLASLKHIWSKDPCGAFTFENLQSVNVESCKDLKYVVPESIACGLLQLQKLRICNCNNVEVIIAKEKDERSHTSFQFPELTMLELVDLKEMRSLYEGPHTFHCPKLKILAVEGSNIFVEKPQDMVVECRDKTEAWVGEGSENVHYHNEGIEFTQLNTVKLKNLPQLTDFCDIKEETGLEELTADVKSTTLLLLFNEMVSFTNIMRLEVYNCNSLKYLFTISMVECLVQLKELEINNCELVEEIILNKKDEEMEKDSINKIVFPNLDYLSLEELPNVKSFSRGYPIEFQSLKELSIIRCSAMENFVSKSSGRSNNNESGELLFNEMVTFSKLEMLNVKHMNRFKYLWQDQFTADNSFFGLHLLRIEYCSKLSIVFPSNLCRRFQKLETLYLSCCSRVVEIYQHQSINSEEINAVEAFSLRDLQIQNLPSLKYIWSRDSCGASTFQNLQSVVVYSCKNLKYVFPKSIACGFLQLQQLRIGNCDVEVMVAKGRNEQSESALSLKFPELTVLQLENLNQIKSLYEGPHTFEWPKLKCLEVHDCDKGIKFGSKTSGYHQENRKSGEHNIPIEHSILFVEEFMHTLEELTLDHQGLKAMQSEFPVDLLPKLKKVTLRSLEDKSVSLLFGFLARYSLEKVTFTESFMEEMFLLDDEGEFREDEYLRIKHLELVCDDNLKHLLKDHSQLNPILQHLQTLTVQFCDELINIVPSSASFQNLLKLDVGYCESMINLVTTSTSKTMVQLMELRVSGCPRMEEIISNDQDCTEQDEIIFNKLKRLELKELPILSFCSGNHTFNFPLLEQVVVKKCYRMKIFCGRDLSTPKLLGVLFEDEQSWKGDLNATIALRKSYLN